MDHRLLDDLTQPLVSRPMARRLDLPRFDDEIRMVYPNLPARFLHGRAGLELEPWQSPKTKFILGEGSA